MSKVNDFRSIWQMLKSKGIADPVAGWAAAAVFHETGDLKSKVSKADKNYSGIQWIDKPYQPATKGSPRPKGEGGGFYARYSTTQKWADDYARILNLGKNKPAQATSIDDFVARLKANRYFTDNPANYAKGVRFFYDKYAVPAVKADTQHEAAKKDYYIKETARFQDAASKALKFDFKQWFKDNPVAGTAIVVIGGALVVKAISR